MIRTIKPQKWQPAWLMKHCFPCSCQCSYVRTYVHIFWSIWSQLTGQHMRHNLRMAQGMKCLHAIWNYIRKVKLKYQHVFGINTRSWHAAIILFEDTHDKICKMMLDDSSSIKVPVSDWLLCRSHSSSVWLYVFLQLAGDLYT